MVTTALGNGSAAGLEFGRNRMLTVISPAKTLDFDTPAGTDSATQPEFLAQSAGLVEDARALSPEDIQALMGVSENIAQLNHRRFMDWRVPFELDNAKQSILAFKGDVYTGLEASTLTEAQLSFAQSHLRILSGLYGVLRPLDLMQPYRLEMGLKFVNRGGKNLYQFWGDAITKSLNKQLQNSRSKVLVNLASHEYFKSVQSKMLDADIITPVFKDFKGGKYKVISFFAKRARGQMARFIIDNELDEPDGIKAFTADGYRYNKAESSAREWLFTRKDRPV
jgi:cytoplasmic iron level regulating protein YaaA (DUF328/UPF0246 family)